MKLSWHGLKMSIAGAKLSHLVQKDKIWDHGSMIEQVKTIYYKLQRAKNAGQIEDLKKYLTPACYRRLEKEMDDLDRGSKTWIIKNPVIQEIAVIEVHPAKSNRPDNFKALIKGKGIALVTDKNHPEELVDYSRHIHNFSEQWSFVRQGDWWLLESC